MKFTRDVADVFFRFINVDMVERQIITRTELKRNTTDYFILKFSIPRGLYLQILINILI